ncbi:tRNA threonylcarbamoyladenosine dehydratase [Psittacicella hinzii]|uniref:THIF-type NAD/FAD binding fold domain-containing protein n=1 Tax=Psittacicella hinzii TaxID=2028575 RepID=A0A3A1YQA1_9GAMM|nr:tRNA threonylcarbamoyladenosine dehydratase [Psittacicella hinzii]RIY38524.1 hypothetical protein CKF58_04175 [Psittacicella hinzii]
MTTKSVNPDLQSYARSYALAFEGIYRLYGELALNAFSRAQVIVIGLGGVGSWVVETLARTGIGSIILVDGDDICTSNINRQLIATFDTIGEQKSEALNDRIESINDKAKVIIYDEYLTPDNMSEIIRPHTYTNACFAEGEIEIEPEHLYVIDAIDNAELKAALINYCRRNKYRLVVCGGAGGKVDPAKIRLADMTETTQDPLIANVRNRLRREYGYKERFKDKKFVVPTVYSVEQMKLPPNKKACDLKSLNCNNGYGSATAVTATFANFAASHVLNQIIKDAERTHAKAEK